MHLTQCGVGTEMRQACPGSSFCPSKVCEYIVVQGSIPDMTATTAMYLELQRIFRERANSDVAALETHVRHIEAAAGRSSPRLPSSAIRFFAKHARNIRRVPLSL